MISEVGVCEHCKKPFTPRPEDVRMGQARLCPKCNQTSIGEVAASPTLGTGTVMLLDAADGQFGLIQE